MNEPRNETELVRLIINTLNSAGHFVWRNNTGLMHMSYTDKKGKSKFRRFMAGIKGSSDILGIASDGKFIAIEAKYGYNKPTESQKAFLKEIDSRGGYAVVAKSVEDLPEMLKHPINSEW